jgi:thiosulfate dehydrogenase [quinone] large subunit
VSTHDTRIADGAERLETSDGTIPPGRAARGRFLNGWPTLPLRVFLAAIFLFGGYAKLTYPGFFDAKASFGFKSAVDSARSGTPIGGLMRPLSDHASLFGHVTAFAELAIGLGILVGLLTRIAALGGIVLSTMIALSINWNSVKEYTGNGGWFTSVDFAVAAALSVFLIGGSGPLSVDRAVGAVRRRRLAKEEAAERSVSSQSRAAESSADLEDSRRRLRGEDDSFQAQQAAAGRGGVASAPAGSYGSRGEHPTEQLPTSAPTPAPAGQPAEPVREDGSLWNAPRTQPGESDQR